MKKVSKVKQVSKIKKARCVRLTDSDFNLIKKNARSFQAWIEFCVEGLRSENN